MYVGTMHDIRRCMCRRAGGHDIPGPLSYMHICAAWPLPSATPHGECTSADQSGHADHHSVPLSPLLRVLVCLVRIRVRVRVRVRDRVRVRVRVRAWVRVRVSGQGQGQGQG